MTTSKRGFTMVEVLVVIGIIVLLLVLAVPAFNLLSGSRSIDGAENNLSAFLGRARAEAIGLQRETGVFFFRDQATGRVNAILVQAIDGALPIGGNRELYLDTVEGAEFMALPTGVGLQTIDNTVLNASNARLDDGYIGFNTTPDEFQYGGVILFDGQGRLISKRYGFDFQTDSGGQTRVAQLFRAPSTVPLFDPFPQDAADIEYHPRSAFGVILFDAGAFENNGTPADPQCANPPAYTTAEAGEETWLDENASPVLVNRFNGTLVRGE